MADIIVKKDFEEILDKKLSQYQGAFLEAVDFKFNKVGADIAEIKFDIKNLEKRIDSFDQKLDKLATTLDNFVKIMTDYKEEFIILKAEVDQIKSVLKEKFGIKIAAQG